MCLALMATACGDDDSGDNAETPDTTPTVVTTTPDDGTQPPGTTADPGTPDEVGPAPQPLAETVSLEVGSNILLPFMAPVILAIEFGEFEKENLDITEIQVIPASDAMVLLGQGTLDIQYGAPDAQMMNAFSQGIDIRWVGGNFRDPLGTAIGLWARRDVFSDPENPDLSELAGKTIATSSGPGGISGVPIAGILEGLGVDPADTQREQIPSAEILLALENDAVDAGWLISPFYSQAEESGDYVYVGGPQDLQPIGGALFGPNLINDNRDAGVAFLRALQRTINTYLSGDWTSDDAVVAAIAQGTGLDEDVVRNQPLYEFVLDPSEGLTDLAQQVFFADDVLSYDDPIPESDLVDRSFLEEARG